MLSHASSLRRQYLIVFIGPDPRVLFGDVNMNAGSCTEGAPGCKCSWVKPEYKSCNYHIEGMGLISRVHGAGKEVSSLFSHDILAV
jgi:hypothetical protein